MPTTMREEKVFIHTFMFNTINNLIIKTTPQFCFKISLCSATKRETCLLSISSCFKKLQRVEPLLCNDREMGRYNRAVSGQ
jgi:hypothetical protein